MAKKTNPNGANQYLVDPRQALFLEYYFDRKSETFSNGLQSALKAGYEQSYAEVIAARMPEWLSEKVKELNMLSKAERNMDEVLDLIVKQPILISKELVVDDSGNPIEVIDAQLLKIKADMSKFIASALNKKKYGQKSGGITIEKGIIIAQGLLCFVRTENCGY